MVLFNMVKAVDAWDWESDNNFKFKVLEDEHDEGDLHGHGHPATLETGKRRQAYQGGVGRCTMIFF